MYWIITGELVQRQVDQDPTATHITTHGRRITHATSPPACPAGPTWFIVQGMLHSASIHAQKPAPERSTDAHITRPKVRAFRKEKCLFSWLPLLTVVASDILMGGKLSKQWPHVDVN